MTFDGRGDGTRTHGLCVPNAALYQTEPHLVNAVISTALIIISYSSENVNRNYKKFKNYSSGTSVSDSD